MLNFDELNFGISLILVHCSAATVPCVWRGSQGAVRSSLNLRLVFRRAGRAAALWSSLPSPAAPMVAGTRTATLALPLPPPFSRLPSCCPWKGSRGGRCRSSLCTGTGPFPAVWSQASSVIFGLLLWQNEYMLPFTLHLYLGRTHKPKEHRVS